MPPIAPGTNARWRLHIGLTTGGAYGNKDRGAGRARKAGRPAPAALRVTGRAAREFGAEGEREGVERLVRALDPAAAQRSAGHALACSGKLTGDIAGVLGARLRGARDGDYGFSRSMAVMPGQRLGPVRGAGFPGGPVRRVLVWLVPGLVCRGPGRRHVSGWSGGAGPCAPGCCAVLAQRSEERRVGKEGRSRWSPY